MDVVSAHQHPAQPLGGDLLAVGRLVAPHLREGVGQAVEQFLGRDERLVLPHFVQVPQQDDSGTFTGNTLVPLVLYTLNVQKGQRVDNGRPATASRDGDALQRTPPFPSSTPYTFGKIRPGGPDRVPDVVGPSGEVVADTALDDLRPWLRQRVDALRERIAHPLPRPGLECGRCRFVAGCNAHG